LNHKGKPYRIIRPCEAIQKSPHIQTLPNIYALFCENIGKIAYNRHYSMKSYRHCLITPSCGFFGHYRPIRHSFSSKMSK